MQRFWSQGTKEKYIQLCCSDCLPLLIDDPKTKQAISDLAITLFSGATEGTITRGQAKPSCMAVVTANFTVWEKEKLVYIYIVDIYFTMYNHTHRYLSRCLLIEYKQPCLYATMAQFEELNNLMNTLSSSVGYMISLGKIFDQTITKDLDDVILSKLYELFGENVIPRVYIGYGILIWFIKQVCCYMQI